VTPVSAASTTRKGFGSRKDSLPFRLPNPFSSFDVPFQESVRLVEDLRKQHVDVEQLIFPDEAHSFLTQEAWLRCLRATAEFLERRLATTGGTDTKGSGPRGGINGVSSFFRAKARKGDAANSVRHDCCHRRSTTGESYRWFALEAWQG